MEKEIKSEQNLRYSAPALCQNCGATGLVSQDKRKTLKELECNNCQCTGFITIDRGTRYIPVQTQSEPTQSEPKKETKE